MSRPIVIDTGALHRLESDEKIFEVISKQGFKYYDYNLFWKNVCDHIGLGPDYKDKALAVKTLGEKYGLSCRQTHATFLTGEDEDSLKREIDYVCKEIEISSILGAKGVVIHPILYGTIEENIKLFKETFSPIATKYGIRIYIENTWGVRNNKPSPICTSTPSDMQKILEGINEDNVGMCLDVGHAEMNQLETSAVDFIHTIKDKIWALHIHDNDKWCDAHQMPYTHKINFKNIFDALKEEHYQGDITFEVETCYSKGEDPTGALPLELFPAFIRLQYEIGAYFAGILDNN